MAAPRVNRSFAPTHQRRERGSTAASTVFQVLDVARPGIESSLPALVARAQPTAPLNQ